MIKLSEILLIRHGETQWNTERKFQGRTDIPLSEDGKEQASALAERLRYIAIDRLYSSPLKRAVETARPISDLKGIEITVRPEIAEIDFGKWEGLSIDQIKEDYTEEYNRSRSDPYKYGFREGLSFDEVKNGLAEFVSDCLRGKAERIAVVSHSVILKMILLELLSLPPQFIHTFRIDNCSISVLKMDEYFQKLVLVKLNDTGALV